MKVTKTQFKQIIKEELQRVLKEMHGGGCAEMEDPAMVAIGSAGTDDMGVEDYAMLAMKAIHDLANAAGVELQSQVSGPSDADHEEDFEEEKGVET